MPIKEKKYRPYFTLLDLKIIRDTCKTFNNFPTTNIITYLDEFIAQIEFGIRKESHTTNPSPTVEEKLGFGKITITRPVDQTSEEWRYENGKMSPEEEKEFEKKLGL